MREWVEHTGRVYLVGPSFGPGWCVTEDLYLSGEGRDTESKELIFSPYSYLGDSILITPLVYSIYETHYTHFVTDRVSCRSHVQPKWTVRGTSVDSNTGDDPGLRLLELIRFPFCHYLGHTYYLSAVTR